MITALKSLSDNSNTFFILVLVLVSCLFSLELWFLWLLAWGMIFGYILNILVIMLRDSWSCFNLLFSRQFCCLGLPIYSDLFFVFDRLAFRALQCYSGLPHSSGATGAPAQSLRCCLWGQKVFPGVPGPPSAEQGGGQKLLLLCLLCCWWKAGSPAVAPWLSRSLLGSLVGLCWASSFLSFDQRQQASTVVELFFFFFVNVCRWFQVSDFPNPKSWVYERLKNKPTRNSLHVIPQVLRSLVSLLSSFQPS